MRNDDLVEGDETFTMNLNVPVSPGIVAGAITTATGIILDSTSELTYCFQEFIIKEGRESIQLQ